MNRQAARRKPGRYFCRAEGGRGVYSVELQTGDKERAACNFEKALELNPQSYEASERLKDARRK